MRAMRSPSIVLALGLLVAAGACKKDEQKKPDEKKTSDVAAGAIKNPIEDMKQRGRQRGADAIRRLKMVPIEPAEVAGLIPQIPGGQPIGQAGPAMGGRQVKASQCVTGDVDRTTAAVLTALEAKGFAKVKSRPHPKSPAVRLVSGEKAPYRVGGSVQQGDYVDCPVKSGKTKVMLSFFKREIDDQAASQTSEPAAEDAP